MVLGRINPFASILFMSAESRNIVLLGFMGTGKTTVSQALATELGYPAIDLDACIEAKAGRSIPEIFEQDGEDAFRALEHQIVKEVASRRNQVISCGGGIVKNPANIDLLRASGTLFCLTATPETILERVGQETHRPLLAGENRLDRIRILLDERAPLYAQIREQVATDGKTPQALGHEILGRMLWPSGD
ncbi:MAG: shikimate kinase [Kiritimatiellia bacterium]